jgi:hypothetical protein
MPETVLKITKHESKSKVHPRTSYEGPEGRVSSVGIATRYRQNGPGIESRWRRDFPRPSIPALGPTQPPTQWAPLHFSGGKAAVAWLRLPTPSSAGVKERVELNIYSLSEPLGIT